MIRSFIRRFLTGFTIGIILASVLAGIILILGSVGWAFTAGLAGGFVTAYVIARPGRHSRGKIRPPADDISRRFIP